MIGVDWGADAASPIDLSAWVGVFVGAFIAMVGLALAIGSVAGTISSLREVYGEEEEHPVVARLGFGATFLILGGAVIVLAWTSAIYPGGHAQLVQYRKSHAAQERIESARVAAVREGWAVSERDAERLIATVGRNDSRESFGYERERDTNVVTLGDGRTLNAWLKVDDDRAYLMLSEENTPVPLVASPSAAARP